MIRPRSWLAVWVLVVDALADGLVAVVWAVDRFLARHRR